MLSALVIWFLVLLTVMVVLAGAGIAAFSWQLNRHNRVVPDIETAAPLTWLISPAQSARLHRRLRNAAAPVMPPPAPKRTRRHRGAAPEGPTDELRRGLVDQVVAVDQHLIFTARLPGPARRPQQRALQQQVADIERLSSRILAHERRTAMPAAGPGTRPSTPPAVLADLTQQLDLLEQAHDELAAIEQANGLLDPEAVLHQIATPAPMPARTLPPPRPDQRVVSPPPRPDQRVPGPAAPPTAPPHPGQRVAGPPPRPAPR